MCNWLWGKDIVIVEDKKGSQNCQFMIYCIDKSDAIGPGEFPVIDSYLSVYYNSILLNAIASYTAAYHSHFSLDVCHWKYSEAPSRLGHHDQEIAWTQFDESIG